MDKTGMAAALTQWRETRQPEVLGELLKAQRDRAYSVAVRVTGSTADAEDVVQQAFIKLLSRTSGFEDVEAFELAVYRAVVQCALDAIRQRKRRLMREAQASPSTGDEPVVQSAPSETQEERAEVLTLLRQAVDELPDDERVPTVLCYYQGLSPTQTARTLELPRETVRARLARALTHLRQTVSRHGKKATIPAILALLWQDGALAAPPSLCQALDKALPGRACADIPALAQMGPAATGVSAGTLAVAAVLLAVMGTGLYLGLNGMQGSETQIAKNEPVVTAGIRKSGAQERAGEASVESPRPLPAVTEARKEENVKSKLGALVLVGGMLLPGAVLAGDPSPDVAKAIAQIESRRTA